MAEKELRKREESLAEWLNYKKYSKSSQKYSSDKPGNADKMGKNQDLSEGSTPA